MSVPARRKSPEGALLEPLEPRLLLSTAGAIGWSLETAPPSAAPSVYELCVDPEADPARLADEAVGGDGTVESYPLDQTFLLHSNPTATKTIHLDFDGHTTVNTLWNWNFNNGDPIVTPPYSFQGGSDFTDAELLRIQYIWERVAEDYLPFDVDVTTEDPGPDALSKTGGGDTEWGIRVCIGGSSYDWYGGGAGGVAYIGSFNWSTDVPTFVFPSNLGNGNEKYVAEASSHEAGHTVGLGHDGTSTTGYYEGHGGGATGWAPIMGVGYYRALVQWSKGEYPDASNQQDDLLIITSQNGFGYRVDDHGDSRPSATPLVVDGSSISGEGMIERNTDVDFFEFTTLSGTVSLSIDPFYRSPNLDILAQLYDSADVLIAESNPVDQLDAYFSVALADGTYYLAVEGTGKGDLVTGYSDYGSLGYFSISGTVPEPEGDYGDAPAAGYATLRADDGARHMSAPGEAILGSIVDVEPDGQPTASADGDDVLDGSDDEDGVVFPGDLVVGDPASTVYVIVSAPGGSGVLNAWIDFNADGDWDDAGEQIFTDEVLTDDTHTLSFAVPETSQTGSTYARFRINSTGGLSYYGLADDGEVEDYLVEIARLDFGDAPDPSYPTLLSTDGARHKIIEGAPHFGYVIDSEMDGQPTASADGDDATGGDDDEDGIIFGGALVQGDPAAELYVHVGSPVGGLLSAWIDFNDDGDWDEADERICHDLSVVMGINTVVFAVPDVGLSQLGVTYARFRVSSAGGLSYDGQAEDGEVEDYTVQIVPPASSTPAVPDLTPDSDTGGHDDDDVTRLDNSGATKTLRFEVAGTVAGAVVRIYADGVEIGSEIATGTTTVVETNGSYDLADGTRAITARQTEPGKLESADSAALPVTIDTVAPVVTVDILATDDPTPALTGTVDDSSAPIEVTVDGVLYDNVTDVGDGTWLLPDDMIDPPLSRGVYDVQAVATDLAGNASGDATADELVIYTIAGDATLDGVVDAQDFTIVKTNYGLQGNWLDGDFTGDGVVDAQDFTIIKQNYGAGESSQAAGEPTPPAEAPPLPEGPPGARTHVPFSFWLPRGARARRWIWRLYCGRDSIDIAERCWGPARSWP